MLKKLDRWTIIGQKTSLGIELRHAAGVGQLGLDRSDDHC
jgi:hypothetical protein